MSSSWVVHPYRQTVRLGNPSWETEPAVDKLPDWHWMEAVHVRIDERPGIARISWTANPNDWTQLPLARLDAADIDLFESGMAVPPAGTILPYPLRILSVPGEDIRIGDRRMIRMRPGSERVFELCVICRYPDGDGDVEIDLGGGYEIHSIAVPKQRLPSLWRADAMPKMPAMLCFVSKKIELDGEPQASLQRRFDAYLRQIEDPLGWFLDNIAPQSGYVPKRRIEALESDEQHMANWLKRVEQATHQNRPRHLGDDDSRWNDLDDDYDRAAE